MRVYIAERNTQQPDAAIGWLLEGGPKISIIGGKNVLHTFQWVQISRVISDRLLEAHLVSDH